MLQCPLWVISGNGVTPASCLFFPSKQTFISRGLHVRFVPIADINHQLFSAVVIALIRLFQFGGPLKTARHGSLQSAGCFSYLISQVALWLTITAGRPPTVS